MVMMMHLICFRYRGGSTSATGASYGYEREHGERGMDAVLTAGAEGGPLGI